MPTGFDKSFDQMNDEELIDASRTAFTYSMFAADEAVGQSWSNLGMAADAEAERRGLTA